MDECHNCRPASPEERAEGNRHGALHHAVATVGSSGDPQHVLATARMYLAFLNGEASPE